MLPKAKYSLIHTLYISFSCTEIINKIAVDDNNNNIHLMETGKCSNILIFDGLSWNTLDTLLLDSLPAEINTVLFKNTLIEKIPDDLFKRIPNVQSIQFINNVYLRTLPESFYTLSKLKILKIDKDIIQDLPANFRSLEQLHLSLHNVPQLQRLLKKIKPFNSLRTLDISNNNLEYVPVEVYELDQLECLDLSSNLIQKITKKMLSIIQLKKLNLANNCINSLKDIGTATLQNIETLDLSNNALFCCNNSISDQLETAVFNPLKYYLCQSASDDTFRLTNLTISNNINELEDGFFNGYTHLFKNLTSLTLVNDKMSKVPSFISSLKKLKYLDLRCNVFSEISIAVRSMHIDTLLY